MKFKKKGVLATALSLPSACILISCTTTATAASNLPMEERFSQAPWEEFKSKLNPSTIFYEDLGQETYIEECGQLFKDKGYPFTNYPGAVSAFELREAKSGLCTNHMFMAYDGEHSCDPTFNGSVTYQELIDHYFNGKPLENIVEKVTDMCRPENPNYILPTKVVFPKVAGDVVAAVDFAKQHKLELSLKSGGGSYLQSSYKKNTLLLNFREYPQYSFTSIVECGGVSSAQESLIEQDWSVGACEVAKARGKPAVIRIAPGQAFDQVYRSVHQFNLEQENGFKYHMFGGFIGVVTPMGFMTGGGLAGPMNGRALGYGADQIVQLEMVLPNGYHVRFGPTKWEEQDGFDVPRTTEVSGVCNTGDPSEEDESKWSWGPCPSDVNFDDLWFAVRGGGGGTYGIILSMVTQLHPYPGKMKYYKGGFDPTEKFGNVSMVEACNQLGNCVQDENILESECCKDWVKTIREMWLDFFFDFATNPSAIGISDKDSRTCSQASGSPHLDFFPAPWAGGSPKEFICYGSTSGKNMLAPAWKDYVVKKSDVLAGLGVPAEIIEAVADNLFQWDETVYDAFANWSLEQSAIWHPEEYKGNAFDVGLTGTPHELIRQYMNLLVPTKYLLEKREAAIAFFLKAVERNFPSTYFAFGGAAPFVDDQTTSISETMRNAAFAYDILNWPGGGDEVNDGAVELAEEALSTWYDYSGEFPAVVEYNHIGTHMFGPLKSDWKKPCPLEWPRAEKEEKCFSVQEASWGTELLGRLEKVKSEIDPDNILNCYYCVGFKKEDDLDDPEDTPTDSSNGSTCMMAWSYVAFSALAWFWFEAGAW